MNNSERNYVVRSRIESVGRELEPRHSVSTEDTEPEGDKAGFTDDPHKVLYPPLFRGEKEMPEEVIHVLKSHALNAIEEEYDKPDQYIYFTMYGSAVSYNWKESGDADVQMWVDFTKFTDTHDTEITEDDLLSDIRRVVQTVNFPSFKELGLYDESMQDDDPDCTGEMLVQYYPKPGTGSEQENLAQKPYACLDLETNKWLVRPKPLKPTFYGEHFMRVQPKAEDIATQAENLISELQRHTLDWQFWYAMYKKYRNHKYKDNFLDSQDKATQEKEGVINLFKNVFEGRKDAYNPGGKGIRDERDILQKLLEVWGVFQNLKHFAREPLPWEEQELPPISSMNDSLGYGLLKWAYRSDTDEILIWSNNAAPWTHTENMVEADWPVLDRPESFKYYTGYSRESGSFSAYDYPYDPKEDDVMPRIEELVNDWRARKVASFRFADWDDVVEKAQRYYNEGRVQLERNGSNNVIGTVNGDNGTYNTEIWRDDPQRPDVISLWSCTCPWGEHAWGRTRIWKKYEGRACAHVLALNWQSQQYPIDDEYGEPGQLGIPGIPPAYAPQPQQPQPNQFMTPVNEAPGSANIIPTQPQQAPPAPAPMPPPRQDSHLLQPNETTQLELPGTFSNFKLGIFQNGDIVRARIKLWGMDDRGQEYIVPANMNGEVLWSDDNETIAIFPINAGPLGSHLVRVQDDTTNFYSDPQGKPFVKPR